MHLDEATRQIDNTIYAQNKEGTCSDLLVISVEGRVLMSSASKPCEGEHVMSSFEGPGTAPPGGSSLTN